MGISSVMFIDYAIRYPEAIPLWVVTGPQVAEELIRWISWVELPKEIVMDQGTNFMSHVLKTVCQVLQIKHLKTLVFHSQSNKLVECFNGTLKGMLRQCTQENEEVRSLVPPLLFVVQEAPQASVCYAPLELVFGLSPWSMTDVICEGWK